MSSSFFHPPRWSHSQTSRQPFCIRHPPPHRRVDTVILEHHPTRVLRWLFASEYGSLGVEFKVVVGSGGRDDMGIRDRR